MVEVRPGRPGDVERLADADLWRQSQHQRDYRADQAADDDAHLFHVGPGDCLDAAQHRVENGWSADGQNGQREVPVKDHRQNDRRRRDDGAGGHAPPAQKQQAGGRPRFYVEPPFEILVCGVDARSIEERHQRDRQDDHRDRQPEVELHEAHAVSVSLPCRTHERDRAELRRHHRETNGPPRQAAIGEEIPFDPVGGLRTTEAVDDDPHQVCSDDQPIEKVHRWRRSGGEDASEQPEGRNHTGVAHQYQTVDSTHAPVFFRRGFRRRHRESIPVQAMGDPRPLSR